MESIRLSEGVSGTDSFNAYNKERAKGLHDLLGFQVDTGKKDDKNKPITQPALAGEHWDKLQEKDNTHALSVKNAIKDALAETPALKKALEQFNSDMKMLNERVKNPPIPGTPEEKHVYNSLIKNLPGILHAAKVEAMDAIKAHQEAAKEKIKDLDKDSFKKGTGLTSDEEVDEAIKELAEVLEKTNSAKLKEFETTFNESIISTHKTLQKEYDRIAFLAAMRNSNNKELKEVQMGIAHLADENKKRLGLTDDQINMGLVPSGSKLSNINVKDFKDLEDFPLKTITGRKIKIEEDGSFNITLPKFGLIYYNRRDQYVDYDLQSLAEAFKAAGNDTVTISVDYKNTEEAEEYARKMYEACINAGFEPDKINIKVNGAERKLTNPGKKDEAPGIFDKDTSRLSATRRIADKLKAIREEEAKPPKHTAEFKAKLDELRSAPMPTPQPEPTATQHHVLGS
ncbi:hypothetical protein [Legionella clemsonensis]|uniref:hypothetical protein n=1 Tax=Legionella clemsonensis TaxID=1867846 RepID=UPI0012FD09C5|nr:hypothetical protein [Legionella clemsonensis]